MTWWTELVLRPAVRARDGMLFLSVRSWRAEVREAQLTAMKAEKLSLGPDCLAAAADDVARHCTGIAGAWPAWLVSTVPVGHSRRADAWAVRLAGLVAERLGLPFEKLFDDRFVSGSSHPSQNAKLPPLVWRQRPDRPVLVVDDIYTSGFHLAESAAACRAAGVPAIGMAWIGGSALGPGTGAAKPVWAAAEEVDEDVDEGAALTGGGVTLPTGRLCAVPACPAHLRGEAAAKWLVVCSELVAAGTLSAVTLDQIEVYCAAYGRWRSALAHLARHGEIVDSPRTGVPQHNPYATVERQSAQQMLKVGRALGLSPDSRGRVTPADDAASATDEFEGLLA